MDGDVLLDTSPSLYQSQTRKINILQKLSDGQQIDQTITLFSTNRPVPKSLDEKEVRDEVGWVSFDNCEY